MLTKENHHADAVRSLLLPCCQVGDTSLMFLWMLVLSLQCEHHNNVVTLQLMCGNSLCGPWPNSPCVVPQILRRWLPRAAAASSRHCLLCIHYSCARARTAFYNDGMLKCLLQPAMRLLSLIHI